MASFELKGRMVPCTVFRPLVADVARLERDLAAQVARSPELFHRMAVLVDPGVLGDNGADATLSAVVAMLRQHGLVPVGVLGADTREAEALDVAVVADRRPEKTSESSKSQTSALVVERPVRSGQQVYAKGRDLVVLGSVAPGAEVIADGHVHVYGPLRGRAVAGASGDETARILCRQLYAELVVVAGFYRVSEDLPPEVVGRSVSIRWNGQQLEFHPME